MIILFMLLLFKTENNKRKMVFSWVEKLVVELKNKRVNIEWMYYSYLVPKNNKISVFICLKWNGWHRYKFYKF